MNPIPALMADVDVRLFFLMLNREDQNIHSAYNVFQPSEHSGLFSPL